MSNITIHKKDIEANLYIVFFTMALISIAGFGLYKASIGQSVIAFIDFLICLFFAYAVRQVILDTFVFKKKLVLVIVCMAGALSIIFLTANVSAIFWVYPAITGAFVLLGSRMALPLSIIFIILTIALALPMIPTFYFFNMLFSLILLCVSVSIFSVRAETVNKQLIELVDIDPLTNLKNRRSLKGQLVNEITLHKNNIYQSSLLILDLDHFKKINDIYGHTIGDSILVKFSNMLKNSVRETDKVYRYGGEEFIIIANNTRLENAGKLAEHLRQTTEKILTVNNKPVTVSIGVAEVDIEDTDVSWLHRADHALYKAKDSNRNAVYLADGNKKKCKYKPYKKKKQIQFLINHQQYSSKR